MGLGMGVGVGVGAGAGARAGAGAGARSTGAGAGAGARARARARGKLGALTWEESLDEAEDEHVPERREGDDEDDHKGYQGDQIFQNAPQQLHLIRG